MKPICILGWYNHSNIGDEAYKLAFPKLFPQYNFQFSQEVLERDPEVIILGGGDVISPEFLKNINKSPNARKYAMSINLRPENEHQLSPFLKVIARNKTNIPNVTVMPDFTFCLSGDAKNGKKLIRDRFNAERADLYDDVVVLTFNSFLCSREAQLARDYVNFEKVCYDLGHLMDETPASFILIPFGNGFPQNDRIANSFVYATSKFYKKHIVVYDKLSVQDTLDIFAAADAAITSRLHAAIFSCLGNTPFFDITHHTKNEMFMEFIGRKDWSLDYWHFDYVKAKSLLHSFLRQKSLFKTELERTTNFIRKLLQPLSEMEL